jgi:hypothetical protein
MKRHILIYSLGLLTLTAGCATLPWQTSTSTDSDSMANEESKIRDELQQGADEAAALQARQIQVALTENDLVLGMQMQDVRDAWGEPRQVDTAGDPGAGNQRWMYFNGLSSRWSLSSARVVYFEAGKVVGWDTVQPH